jgi:fermentation-respiration switch protein FrsA (DUF1100 family)
VFGGLLVTLWTYKCLMMIIFQNKIIYMPSVPPFSRSEKVSDYASQCRPVKWIEHDLRASDGTALKILEGGIDSTEEVGPTEHVVVLYFQGYVGTLSTRAYTEDYSNASSLPPRLPHISSVLKSLAADHSRKRRYTVAALSYRGFWQSRGRPSQPGIELDARAFLEWAMHRYNGDGTRFVAWGQSVGAGVATVGVSSLLRHQPHDFAAISALLLETPFVDLRTMLVALYPQKFLPYRYLTPFLRSSWDSKTALVSIAKARTNLRVLILEAGADEIVPGGQGALLEHACIDNGLTGVSRVTIPGALHTEVMIKPRGRNQIAAFLRSV